MKKVYDTPVAQWLPSDQFLPVQTTIVSGEEQNFDTEDDPIIPN